MKIKLVRVGNSRGIRLPKAVLSSADYRRRPNCGSRKIAWRLFVSIVPARAGKKPSPPQGHPPMTNCCWTPYPQARSILRTGGGSGITPSG